MNILIVGAGPVGLTAAVELARHGIVADVIDSKQAASTLSRAVGILPGSLRILAPSGVTQRLMKAGTRIDFVQFYRDARPLAAFALNGGRDEHDYLLGLPQDKTEQILHDAFVALGGTVRYDTALSALNQSGDAVSGSVDASFSDGSVNRYDYVIGADGIRSVARESAGLTYAGYDLGETWSIADVDATGVKRGQVTICRLYDGGVVLAIPIDSQRYRIVSSKPDALAALPIDIGVTNIPRQGQFEISVRQVREYGRGRVWLAGDAAHCHSPVGGRGMNLGIADAADLARRLVHGGLDGYSAARHQAGAHAINESERARRAMTSTNRVVATLIDLGLKAVERSVMLQRRFTDQMLDG